MEDDGSVRELNKEEEVYLNTKFEGADGNRPYIKSNYEYKTPDGKMSGFIYGRKVPQHIPIIK